MWRSAGVLTIGAALVIGLGLSGAGGASADEPPRTGASSGERPEVLGLIVRKSSGLVSNRSLEFTMERAGADISSDRMITSTIGVIDFAQPLTFA